MKALLNFLKPAPHIPEIQDTEEVKKKYKYWRLRIFYSMFVGYALYYFTRKSFAAAMPGMIAELGFDKGSLGFLSTVFSVTYGISKFSNGILTDRSNPRYLMALGLIMTGVCNIFFGLSSSILMLAMFWGLNGWFQGYGWPPCARFLTQWYSQSERGSWWSSWTVSHNVGAAILPWIVGLVLFYTGNWRLAIYAPAIICILGGFFLLNRLRDTPQSLGLPSVEKFRNDYTGATKLEEDQKLTQKEILFNYVIKNRYIWILAAAYFFVYVIRQAINDWTALFLIETRGYTTLGSNGVVSLFEVGGFCGTLIAGWASDWLFSAKRGPVNVIFALGMFFSLFAFWVVPEGQTTLDAVAVFAIGFFTFGPQFMIGLCAAELSHKNAAATATGFVGCFSYIGAACAGYPLGRIAQDLGWHGYFYTLVGCSVLAILFLLPLWNVKENKRSETAKADELKSEPEPAR